MQLICSYRTFQVIRQMFRLTQTEVYPSSNCKIHCRIFPETLTPVKVHKIICFLKDVAYLKTFTVNSVLR